MKPCTYAKKVEDINYYIHSHTVNCFKTLKKNNIPNAKDSNK